MQYLIDITSLYIIQNGIDLVFIKAKIGSGYFFAYPVPLAENIIAPVCRQAGLAFVQFIRQSFRLIFLVKGYADKIVFTNRQLYVLN